MRILQGRRQRRTCEYTGISKKLTHSTIYVDNSICFLKLIVGDEAKANRGGEMKKFLVPLLVLSVLAAFVVIGCGGKKTEEVPPEGTTTVETPAPTTAAPEAPAPTTATPETPGD